MNNIVAFPVADVPAGGWHPSELQQLVVLFAAGAERGSVAFWDVGATEAGDPQFYLLGPGPDFECLLCISRLGSLYVLEDGHGWVLNEHHSLLKLADQARSHLRRKKAGLVARLTVAWYALREMFEDKIEPMLAEPAELMAHVAPKLIVFA